MSLSFKRNNFNIVVEKTEVCHKLIQISHFRSIFSYDLKLRNILMFLNELKP
jgi:hypothetical protein